MPASTSLCVICKNEQTNLSAYLGLDSKLVNEIIIVDTGSTDDTKRVASQLGACVFDFPWIDDFAAARNECLRHATGDYIFWMDADEVIDEVNREKLRKLFEQLPVVSGQLSERTPPPAPSPIKGEGNDDRQDAGPTGPTHHSQLTTHQLLAYAMKCRCLPDPHSGVATVVDHIRLFPNHPRLRWKYRVHEQILPALNQLGIPVVGTDIVIDHTGYQDPALVRRKTERNLRLLELDYADHPEDPFILFNLGWTYLTLNQAAKGLGFLQQSLERSNPGDSIVRKIHGLIAQCHLQLGQPGEALAACHAGRARYPDDDELLMMQGRLSEQAGHLAAAEACFRQLVSEKKDYPRINTNKHEEETNHGERGVNGENNQSSSLITHHSSLMTTPPLTTHDSPLTLLPVRFVSVEEGLRGYKARFHLGLVYRRQGKDQQAEEQWRAVLGERPEFVPAALELGRLYLNQQRWPEFDEVVDALLAKDSNPRIHTNGHEEVVSGQLPVVSKEAAGPLATSNWQLATAEAGVLKARGLLARKEFAPARQILEAIIAQQPHWPYPRVILTYVFLQSDDVNSAERVLRDLLVLDPTQVEAWMNLAKLLRNQRRLPEALAACRSGRVHCPNDLDLLLLHGTLLFQAGDLIGAEACFLAVVSSPLSVVKDPSSPSVTRDSERYVSARHQLALIYVELHRPYDAESQWRAALAECPDHGPARQGLDSLQRQRNGKREVLASVS